MDYQVAQKLHAASDPENPGWVNDRVRDVIDLTKLREHFYPEAPPESLTVASLDLFDARAVEAETLGLPARHWPPVVVANDVWRQLYPDLAASVGLMLTLDEAITGINEWIAEIDAARPE